MQEAGSAAWQTLPARPGAPVSRLAEPLLQGPFGRADAQQAVRACELWLGAHTGGFPTFRAVLTLLRAQIAERRGDPAAAIDLYERGVAALSTSGRPGFFLGSRSLAGLLEREGRLDQALRVLGRAAEQHARTYSPAPSTAHWMASQWHRARLLRRLARADQAVRVEAQLRALLAQADADHPVVVQLARLDR